MVASFDGSGGARLWSYWRGVAKRVHAHFTFFVSGVYLVDWAHHASYRPPRHARGESAIGFAPDRAYVAGKLLFRSGAALPFGPSEVVGGRTPCLQGNFSILYPLLAHGFRYDASQTAPLGRWPRRERGLWSLPLLEIPFVGHTFRVVSMDYNFLVTQTLETAARVEQETYRSIWNAFLVSYRGNRAPLSLGYHFETWRGWAYDHALARFLLVACRLPEVRCASFRELVDWLDVKRR